MSYFNGLSLFKCMMCRINCVDVAGGHQCEMALTAIVHSAVTK